MGEASPSHSQKYQICGEATPSSGSVCSDEGGRTHLKLIRNSCTDGGRFPTAGTLASGELRLSSEAAPPPPASRLALSPRSPADGMSSQGAPPSSPPWCILESGTAAGGHTLSPPWDFPLFLSPSPGPREGSDTPTLPIPAPLSAPRAVTVATTRSVQGARFGGRLPRCPR